MADIELVIKLSEYSYKATCNGYMLPSDVENVVQGIKNATPLPKGHGRIADIDKILDEMSATRNYDILSVLERVKPIIEADTESDMDNNIFEKLTPKEQSKLWMYMILNKDKIIEKTEQWTKEAEEAGMTLTKYLESIIPLNNSKKLSWLGKNCKDCGNEKCKKLGILPKGYDCALWQPESEK